MPPRPRLIGRVLLRLLNRPQFDIVHASASQGDGGRVVVEVAVADQFDGPHVVGELVRLRQGQAPDQGGDQG